MMLSGLQRVTSRLHPLVRLGLPRRFTYGVITTRAKTQLYVYEGSLTSEKYKGLLQKALKEIKELLPDSSYFLQQDGAPCPPAHILGTTW